MSRQSHSLRIAIVANTTWNIYNFRLNVVRQLLDRGHTVFVIAPVDEYISYKEDFPGVKHIPLRTLDRDGMNPARDLLLIYELYRKYRILKLDAVLHYTHKPNIYGTIAARLAGIASTAVITGLGYTFINQGLVSRLTRMLYRFSCRDKAKLIFENEDDLMEFRRFGIISPHQGMAVQGCGIDLRYFRSSREKESGREIVFTFIGRLLKDKGIREFIAAAQIVKQRHPNTRFWVVGELDEGNPSTIRSDLLAEWVNDDVIDYHGFVKDVRPLLEETDCLVLPSYREGMPRVIMEGMAMSKPVITTDVPGCRQTVLDGVTGIMVEARDAQSLVNGILKFLDMHPTDRESMGLAGRLRAETYYDQQYIAGQIVSQLDGTPPDTIRANTKKRVLENPDR